MIGSRTQFWGLFLAMLALNFIYSLQMAQKASQEAESNPEEAVESSDESPSQSLRGTELLGPLPTPTP